MAEAQADGGASLSGPGRPCRACGQPVRESASFCPSCGASQTPAAARRRRMEAEGRWHAIRGCVVFYAVYLGTVLPLIWMPQSVKATALIVVSLLDAGIILVYHRLSRVRLRPLVTFEPSVSVQTLLGVGFLVPLLAVNFAYHATLLGWLGLEEPVLSDPFLREGYGVGVIVFTVCVMPAVWEEVAFRGLVQTQLVRVIGGREAVLLTAILFATIHAAFLSWPYLFLVGLLLGALRQRSGSLVPGMVVHFLHNLAVVAFEQGLWRTHG